MWRLYFYTFPFGDLWRLYFYTFPFGDLWRLFFYTFPFGDLWRLSFYTLHLVGTVVGWGSGGRSADELLAGGQADKRPVLIHELDTTERQSTPRPANTPSLTDAARPANTGSLTDQGLRLGEGPGTWIRQGTDDFGAGAGDLEWGRDRGVRLMEGGLYVRPASIDYQPTSR